MKIDHSNYNAHYQYKAVQLTSRMPGPVDGPITLPATVAYFIE